MNAPELVRVSTIQPPPVSWLTVVGDSDDLLEYMEQAGLGGRPVVIIADPNVKADALRIQAMFPEALRPAELLLSHGGEEYKTLLQVKHMWTRLLESKIKRDSVVIVIGGGVLGDVGGFVASTVLRGVPVVQIPTSLTAMVDAGIGGKTGFDYVYKNSIGHFHLPRLVLVDPSFLATLPHANYVEGWGEIIKTAVLDPTGELMELLESNAESLRRFETADPWILARAIRLCVEYKTDMVERDPTEQLGVRILLNLGHTLGHALEKLTKYRLAHGLGVSIGLVFALQLSARLGVLKDPGLPERVARLLETFGLPVTPPEGVTAEEAFEVMRASDKKNVAGGLQFVLVKRVGNCRAKVVPDSDIMEALEAFMPND